MYRKIFALLLFVVFLFPFAAPSRGDLVQPRRHWRTQPYADEERSVRLIFSSLSASPSFISSKHKVDFELFVSGPCHYEYKIVSKNSNAIIKASSGENATLGPGRMQIFSIDTKTLKKQPFECRIHGKVTYYNYKKIKNGEMKKGASLPFDYDVIVNKIKYNVLPSITVNGQKVKIEYAAR